MPAEHFALLITGAHVQVRVKRAVHRVDRAGQRDDLEIARERIGVVLLFGRVEHADRKLPDCTERLHARELDLLGLRNGRNLLKHFFPTVDAGDDGVSKSSILHGSPPLLRYRNYTAPPCRPQGGAGNYSSSNAPV